MASLLMMATGRVPLAPSLPPDQAWRRRCPPASRVMLGQAPRFRVGRRKLRLDLSDLVLVFLVVRHEGELRVEGGLLPDPELAVEGGDDQGFSAPCQSPLDRPVHAL